MLHVHLKCFSLYLRHIKPQEFASHLSQPRLLPEVATGVSYKKDVLKYFAKFIGKHLCQSLFFNNVAGLKHIECAYLYLAHLKLQEFNSP